MEDLPLYLRLVIILLLVAGNAFSSDLRLRSRQRGAAGSGNSPRTATSAPRPCRMLHEEPERFYSVTQVGITLVSLGLGAVGMETLHTVIDPYVVSIFTALGDHDLATQRRPHVRLRAVLCHRLVRPHRWWRARPQGARLP
jgi:CBS domain containing-hemolysin-like protein